jgi:hypothetical protein
MTTRVFGVEDDLTIAAVFENGLRQRGLEVEKAIDPGATEFITKPFEWSQLWSAFGCVADGR